METTPEQRLEHRYNKWCTTPDDWYPCFEGNRVEVSVMILPLPKKGEIVRTCVWGADDFGMARDEFVADFGAARCLFYYRKKEVAKWTRVTTAELTKIGFVGA